MIKARVKETGLVIHVVFDGHVCTMAGGETEIWRDLKTHNLYRSEDLDFQNLDSSEEDVKEKFLSKDSEYKEKLRHQYMGQAMQSLIQSGVFPIDDKHDVSMHVIARKAYEMADALIYEIFKDRRPVTSDIGNCCKEG